MLLAISSTLFREAIQKIIESQEEIEIIAEASTHMDIIPLVEQMKPAVLFVDSNLPNLDIEKILKSTSEKNPETRVLLLLHTLDEEAIINALSFGVQGYLTDKSNTGYFIQAIRTLSKDEMYAEGKLVAKFIRGLLTPRKGTIALKPRLTKREDEIVNLIIQGYRNKQIAFKLSISEHTVKNHIENIFKKLGISNRMNLLNNL